MASSQRAENRNEYPACQLTYHMSILTTNIDACEPPTKYTSMPAQTVRTHPTLFPQALSPEPETFQETLHP
jgi:hypothetical protein